MEGTIFAKIIRREIPADIVYEDADTLAFLDIHPVNPGHTLVIPKKPSRNVLDIDPETLGSVMRTVQKVAVALKEITGAEGMTVTINNEPAGGQVIFHTHVHVIPRFSSDNLPLWPHKSYTEDDAAALAAKLRAAIN